MKTSNKVCEAIRELICLGFFTRNNFNIHTNKIFLGEYQYNDKKYEIYSSWASESQVSIFIKCENESIHLIIEDDERSRRFNGPVSNDVYLHVNNYRNIGFNDVVYLYLLEKVNKENIIYESKIQLDYSRSCYIFTDPNGLGLGSCGFKGKKFIFNRPEYFDEKLKNKKCIEMFKDVFSPEIILNLINQIYPNFEQIYINDKIDGIINSLTEEELLILREKLHAKTKKLQKHKKM